MRPEMMDTATPEPQQLPHNLEMEQALLGAILVNNECLAVVDFLMPEHFFEPLHGRIYAACLTLNAAGTVASPVTVKDYFTGDEALKSVGGAKYLAQLTVAAVTVLHSKDYGKALYDLWVRRRIIEAAEKAISVAAAPKSDQVGEAMLHDLEADLGTIRGTSLGEKTAWTMPQALVEMWEIHESLKNGTAQKAMIPFGISRLDKILGGVVRGEYGVVGARMGMGKSMFACQFAVNAALQGYGVGFISPDMGHRQMVARMVTAYAWLSEGQVLSYEDILKGRLDALDAKVVAHAMKKLADLPIKLDDKANPMVANMVTRSRDWQRQFRREERSLDLVLFDHMHNARASKSVRGRGRTAEVAEISNDLKAAARDLDVGLCAFAQLTEHDKASQEIKRPKLGDLRWADEIEQDARFVTFLHRPWYYKKDKEPQRKQFKSELAYRDALLEWESERDGERDLVELIVAKQNNGPTGIVTAYCDLAANVVSETRVRP